MSSRTNHTIKELEVIGFSFDLLPKFADHGVTKGFTKYLEDLFLNGTFTLKEVRQVAVWLCRFGLKSRVPHVIKSLKDRKALRGKLATQGFMRYDPRTRRRTFLIKEEVAA